MLSPANPAAESSAVAKAHTERFPALEAAGVCQHIFIGRVAGVDVSIDKDAALLRLDATHRRIRHSLGLNGRPLITAEQVHGDGIGVVDGPLESDQSFAGCDGLATNQGGVCLGIYVADCSAVYFVDPVRRAIALVHSGRKGTELGIASRAVELMAERFASRPEDLIVQLSPCIRPPHYETDFAAQIIQQARAAGVSHVHDQGKCTACEGERYYSYRAAKGRTGRMLALLALEL